METLTITILEPKVKQLLADLEDLSLIKVKTGSSTSPASTVSETTGRKPSRKAGNSEGKYEMSDDFDAPLEDFKEYME